jgi:hypothetical protein
MERWFFVEAKSFVFSMTVGEVVVLLEGFSLCCVFGSSMHCMAGCDGGSGTRVQDFIKSFREGQQVLIVCRDGNRTSGFLEFVVYTEGGWKGLILLPKGGMKGWDRADLLGS